MKCLYFMRFNLVNEPNSKRLERGNNPSKKVDWNMYFLLGTKNICIWPKMRKNKLEIYNFRDKMGCLVCYLYVTCHIKTGIMWRDIKNELLGGT